MKKLLKLRQWLTIDETAEHLASMLGENVSEADIYRLALDGHLRLSVNFVNHARGRVGKIVGPDEVRWREWPAGFPLPDGLPDEAKDKPVKIMTSFQIDEERYINLDESVTSIDGVWDLLMIGNEALDIEHAYHQIASGTEITLCGLDGAFVERDGVVCQLVESFEDNEFQAGSRAALNRLEADIAFKKIPTDKIEQARNQYTDDRKKYLEQKTKQKNEDNYYPAGALPRDSVLVVKTSAIMQFLASINSETPKHEQPLSTTERNTFLVLIAALCQEAGIDYSARGISSAVVKVIENFGVPISDDTIRGIIKQIEGAVQARSK